MNPELRNTFDLAAMALAKELSHLPVVADPSHGTGRRSVIPAMSRAAIAAGADGLIDRSASVPGARAFRRAAVARSGGVRDADEGDGQACAATNGSRAWRTLAEER